MNNDLRQRIIDFERSLISTHEGNLSKLDDMKSELERDDRWPHDGDEYFVLDELFRIFSSSWDDLPVDQTLRNAGVFFKTKEEAEKELEARKVISELMRQPGRKAFESNNGDYGIAVGNGEVWARNWTEYNSLYAFGLAWFDTEKSADNAIATIGSDRILAASEWLSTRPVY